jgi:predicted kinase
MPTAHLICGLPCSGKTTYARGLHEDRDSVLFSLDRWLITTFGRYTLSDVGHDEHVRRVLACRELIWEQCVELLTRSVDVILDDGFFLRENRIQCVEAAKSAGAQAMIHLVETPVSVIQSRLASRNAALPRHNFAIDPATLLSFVGLFERPSSDEGATLRVPRASGTD